MKFSRKPIFDGTILSRSGDAGTSGRERLGDDAGELREHERDSEPAERHGREVVPQVVDLWAEHDEPVEAAAGVQDAAGDEERSLPDAAGQLAGHPTFIHAVERSGNQRPQTHRLKP